MKHEGFFLNSGQLFAVAADAAKRSVAAEEGIWAPTLREPLIAIVFAAAAGEAFINELGEVAERWWREEAEEVRTLGALLGAAESSRGNTELKYLLAKVALGKRTFDRGTKPFQDFALLLELRNALMHLKADRFEFASTPEPRVNYPSVIKKLRDKNILAELPPGTTTWLALVSTAAVARWACNSTSTIVSDLVSELPAPGGLREYVQIWAEAFESV
jgi:hypothetical protein